MVKKSIMEMADDILGNFGVGKPLVESTEPVKDSTPPQPSQPSQPMIKPVAMPTDGELPVLPNTFRNLIFETMGYETDNKAYTKSEDNELLVEEVKKGDKDIRDITPEEIRIVLEAARILKETTFTGALGTNTAGATSFEVDKKKKRKKGQLKEFANTTDPNVWKPEKNNMYTKKTSLSVLTQGILKKIKK